MSHVRAIAIPQTGEGLVEARVTALYRVPGDPVSTVDVLYEIETDKATLDIESPVDGTLIRWLADVGDVVSIGAPIAEVLITSDVSHKSSTLDPEILEPTIVPKSSAGAHNGPALVPPRTREYALQMGLQAGELSQIPAAGRFVLPLDVDGYLQRRAHSETPAYHSRVEEKVTSRQRSMNDAMSAHDIPRVSAMVAVRVDAELLSRATTSLASSMTEHDGLITEFQVLCHCAVKAAVGHKPLRSMLTRRDTLLVYDHVNIGISVSAPSGEIFMAGIDGAGDMGFTQFRSQFMAAVSQATRGASTINAHTALLMSSLGEAVTFASPVVVPPATATLFMGGRHRADSRGDMRNLVLSFNHCVFNGEQAAAYLNSVCAEVAALAGVATPPNLDTRRDDLPLGAAVADWPERVNRITEGVLGEQVDTATSLRELGIDSLRATAIIQRLNKKFGLTLAVDVMYRCANLAELAAAVELAASRRD